MSEPVAFRSRKACLTPADLAAFSARLVEALPDALIFGGDIYSVGDVEEFPTIPVGLQLTDVSDYTRILHFDHEWVPQWERNDRGGWFLSYPRLPYVRFLMRARVWPADRDRPERIGTTEIDVSCRPHRPEDFAMARRLFAALAKVATHRNQKVVAYPSQEVLHVHEKGNWLWIGFDAIRWAREDPRRLFAVNPFQKWGIRPLDDGVPVVNVRPPRSRPQLSGPIGWRRREVCFAAQDWQAFADLVVERFPTARCFTVPSWRPSYPPEPPAVPSALHLLDLPETDASSLGRPGTNFGLWHENLPGAARVIHFDEHWLPRWQKAAKDGAWELPYPRLPYLMVAVDPGPVREKPDAPVCLLRSRMEFALRRDEASHLDLARHVFALLPRLGTHPDCECVGGYPRTPVVRPSAWIGHHALAWARADRQRTLAWSYDISYRPVATG